MKKEIQMAKIRLGYDVIVVQENDGVENQAFVGKVIRDNSPSGFDVAVMDYAEHQETPANNLGAVTVIGGMFHAGDTARNQPEGHSGELTYLRTLGEHYEILDAREHAARAAAAELPDSLPADAVGASAAQDGA
jgi:hypothetical protein